MINGYELKNDVLRIYFDIGVEFSRYGKNKNLISKIKQYINDNHIKFKSGVIEIMVGGVLLGSFIFNNINNSYSINNNSNNNIVEIMHNDYNEYNALENIVVEDANISNENINGILGEEFKEQVVDNNDNIYSVVSNCNVNDSKSIVNDTVNNVNSNDIVESNIENSTKVEEVVDNNIYVDLIKDGKTLNLELEEYIIGVVGAEMPASFNIEALKAQAIIARTYALKCISIGKVLTSDSSTQNYKTIDELKNMWGNSFDLYFNKISNAVNSTKGMYLTYNGNYIDAVYHSTSNGNTEDAIYVWGNSVPYLKSVSSLYDNTNKSYSVSTIFSYEDISNKLNILVDSDTSFNILNRNSSNRVVEIEINGNTYSGVEFRKILNLRSTDFSIVNDGEKIVINTNGYGHGVGMSQYGANGMANNGYSYKDILLHYYIGCSVNS